MKRRLLALSVAAAIPVLGLTASACTSTTTICEGKGCPVTVVKRASERIDGPSGWMWFYFLYMNTGAFYSVPYSTYNVYNIGRTYGTLGSEEAAAGTSAFVPETQAMATESAADDEDESYLDDVVSDGDPDASDYDSLANDPSVDESSDDPGDDDTTNPDDVSDDGSDDTEYSDGDGNSPDTENSDDSYGDEGDDSISDDIGGDDGGDDG